MSAYKKDRIAALATPPGPGALAVIRISGENLSGLIPQLTGQNSLAPRYALYTSILSPVDGETLDKGIVTFFNSPHSFTGEDVIEISCHGGEHIPRSILSALYASGVRPANPGEFSFRAFINGKIDLVQAESITTLISAKTSKGVSASLSGLSGKLTSNIDVLKIQLLNTLSMIEHELDFSEDEISHIEIKTYIHSIEQVGITLSSILESAAFGKAVFNGVRVVLIGRPNTGKSSLFNSILGHERAIVSSVPGTTRDTIESWFDLDGFPVCIVDTAGLWDSDNYLESIGIKRTRHELQGADIILFVDDMDPAVEYQNLDADINTETIVFVKTKEDLYPTSERLGKICYTSSEKDLGLKDLLTRLSTTIKKMYDNNVKDDPVLISARQRDLVFQANQQLETILLDLKAGQDMVVIASMIRDCVQSLDSLTGGITNSDVIYNIFNAFCVGK